MRMVRGVVAGFVILGALFSLGGCFFARPPQLPRPTFVVGNVVGPVGEEVEIPVEVWGFPPPGVAGVAVLGLRYDPAALEIRGMTSGNGFNVLCYCVNNADGVVKFIAVNPAEGISAGPVAVLRARRLSKEDPRFSLVAQDLEWWTRTTSRSPPPPSPSNSVVLLPITWSAVSEG